MGYDSTQKLWHSSNKVKGQWTGHQKVYVFLFLN